MPAFTAKDVQKLRQLTGVGMLDAKRGLEENDGDMDRAVTWLREKGLASQAKRADREASEGAVAIGTAEGVVSIVAAAVRDGLRRQVRGVRRLRRRARRPASPPRESTPCPSGATNSTR